ncbi:hypothetical protein [Limnovirga soli]|uniref:Uncharacterized protein n=1 Tax=Limnovirga soli TaxID=2656915 RepID=A0A8J8JQA8_9BACT|nr:hypothetical protein [Limnovirga soli]NNV54527.1 hypothetical protein [Limnovirga soli]
MDEWGVNELSTEDLIRKRNTLMRIALHISNPEELDDDTWAQRWTELVWASRAGFLPFKLD